MARISVGESLIRKTDAKKRKANWKEGRDSEGAESEGRRLVSESTRPGNERIY